MFHRQKAFFSLDGQTGQVDSIDQEILSAWMERKAWRESRKAVVSILAEIISASMVRKAKSGREIFHQLRNLLILDVGDSKKCPNGVHRGRNFLNIDGATTATVIITARGRINGCQAGVVCAGLRVVCARVRLICAKVGLVYARLTFGFCLVGASFCLIGSGLPSPFGFN